MKRIILAALVAIGLSGCKQSKPPEPAQPDTEAKAADEGAPAAAPAEEPKPSKLDEASLVKFIGYQKAVLAVLPQRLAEYQKLGAQAKDKNDTVSAMQFAKRAGELADTIDADRKKAASNAGLSQEDVKRWEELTTYVVNLHTSGASSALEKMAAEAHAKLKTMPAEEQVAAQAQLKELDDAVEKQKKLPDERAEYGDPAVDAVLKHEGELKTLHDQLMSQLAMLKGTPEPK